jgi:prepilin-type N-terminal cleavage/methylation domain-containing protein
MRRQTEASVRTDDHTMNARGFTLIEWLIAMLIGVFLVGGG